MAAAWVRGLWITAGLAVLATFLYLVRDTLPPFLIAFAIAALLDPVLDRLEERGWSRRGAVAVIFLLFLLLFFVVALVLIPMAIYQAVDLLPRVPGYYTHLREWGRGMLTQLAPLLERLHLPSSSKQLLVQFQEQIQTALKALVVRVVATLQQSLGKVVWLAIIPIVTFYLMQDIDAIIRRVLYLIREQHRARVADVGRKVAAVFTGYVRGLFIVCSAYALVNGLILAFGFHVRYALVIALFAGVLYAVPYVGAVATIALGALVALATPGHTSGYVAWVAVSLLATNQLFDQVITPRIVGGLVGLHPVFSIFALTVGGELFGLVGMIMAVPLAASIQVILVELFPSLTRPLPPLPPKARDKKRRSKRDAPAVPVAAPAAGDAPPAHDEGSVTAAIAPPAPQGAKGTRRKKRR